MRLLRASRQLPVAPGAAWEAMIDIRRWPAWGPSVGAARLDGGGRRLRPEATGRVQTAAGPWLPFRVTGWEDGRYWAWSVAFLPATDHLVEPVADDPDACRVSIGVPVWAPLYLPLCWRAIAAIGEVAAGRNPGGPDHGVTSCSWSSSVSVTTMSPLTGSAATELG